MISNIYRLQSTLISNCVFGSLCSAKEGVRVLLSAQSQEAERHANFRLKALASIHKFTVAHAALQYIYICTFLIRQLTPCDTSLPEEVHTCI